MLIVRASCCRCDSGNQEDAHVQPRHSHKHAVKEGERVKKLKTWCKMNSKVDEAVSLSSLASQTV